MSRFSVWNINNKKSGRARRSHYFIGEIGILFTNLPEQSLKRSNFYATLNYRHFQIIRLVISHSEVHAKGP